LSTCRQVYLFFCRLLENEEKLKKWLKMTGDYQESKKELEILLNSQRKLVENSRKKR
jgi:hypothetical protein